MTKIIERTAKDIGLVETQYFTFGNQPEEFMLESDEKLGPVTLAYETYGMLNQDKSNAILILHALTRGLLARLQSTRKPENPTDWIFP